MNLQALIPTALKVSVTLNVFAIGLRANARDVTYMFRRPGALLRALFAMNVLMPLFALTLVLTFDLNPAVKIALVALAVSPIPPLLPKKLVKAGGTIAYATGLLIAAGLLAIILVPLAMEMIERVVHIPLQMTMLSIAELIVMATFIPIGLGVLVRSLSPSLADRLTSPISLLAGIVLLLCVAAISIVAAPTVLSVVGHGTLIAISAFVVAGLVLGYLLGGPEPENRTALAISTASRHPGIAIAIAQANFPEQKLAMAAVLLYLFVNGVLYVPFRMWTKRRQSGK